MKLLFKAEALRKWTETYDERDAVAITARLTVETEELRQPLTIGGLEDNRVLNC